MSHTSAGAAVSPLAVLRAPHVPRLLTSALLGRLPTGMAPLAIVAIVREHHGSYSAAGLLTGLYGASAAVSGPLLGRLIDRTRQGPALLGCAVLAMLAFSALAVLDPVGSSVGAAVAAVVAGAATPQLEPCLRVLWSDVLSEPRLVRAAFSLDAATQEVIFVAGPVVVIAATTVGGAPAGLLSAGLLGLVGTAWFASAAPARRWRGSPTHRHWAGPLRSRGMLRLLAALICVGASVGTFVIVANGFAESRGALGSAGWLLAANAAGALLCGVAYTRAPTARHEDRRLLLLLAALAVGYLPLLLSGGLWSMAFFAFLGGCALPPLLASSFSLVAVLAPDGTITEAHAWMITSFGVGNAVGPALAGALLDQLSINAVLLLPAVFGGLAAVFALAPMTRRAPHHRAIPAR